MIPAVIVPKGAAGEAYEIGASAILCDCGCHPQSVKACACSRAEELRVEMAGMAAGGKSGAEIMAFYVAQHGEKILVAPRASGFNLIAWMGPGVGLMVAIVAVGLVIRRWRRAEVTAPARETPSPEGDEGYLERLRRDVEEIR